MHYGAELRGAGRCGRHRKKLNARLVWNERYHEQEFSILAAIKKGRPVPDWVDDEPFLEPGEYWILEAYGDLLTCRTLDGVIPWSAIVEYADRAGLEPDVTQAFVRIIRYLDMERIERQRRKRGRGEYEDLKEGVHEIDEATANKIQAGTRMQPASQDQMIAAAKARMLRAKEGRRGK